MQTGGYIKIYRTLMDNYIYRADPMRLMCWIDLLLLASWQDCVMNIKGKDIEVKRGQIVTTASALAKRWVSNQKQAQRILRRFVQLGMIKVVTQSHRYSIITIVNYEQYQGVQPSVQPSVQPKSRINDSITTNCEDCKKENVQPSVQPSVQPIYNNKKNNNNISLHDNARTREEEFLFRSSDDSQWLDIVQTHFNVPPDEAVARLQEFQRHCVLGDVKHDNIADFKRHFRDWLRIKKNEEKKQQQHDTSIQQRRDPRREGTDCPTEEKPDYSGKF